MAFDSVDLWNQKKQLGMTSIIIPAHNEKYHLEKLLPRLLDICATSNAEIVVALSPKTNDGSESIAIRENLQFHRCGQQGRAAQMNEGARLAKGPYLAFLHADVLPPASFISDIEHSLKNGNDAGFFSYVFDRDHPLLRLNASFTAKDGFFTGGGDQCLFIKRHVFLEMGGFDEEQLLMEDFEFFKRMRSRKVPYTIVKNNLVVSARKYGLNSYWRINFTNLLLVLLFRLGYPSAKLKVLHDRWIRTSYPKQG